MGATRAFVILAIIIELVCLLYALPCAGVRGDNLTYYVYMQTVFSKYCLLYFKMFSIMVMVFNATFSNISVMSWRSILLVEQTGIPGENHRPVTC